MRVSFVVLGIVVLVAGLIFLIPNALSACAPNQVQSEQSGQQLCSDVRPWAYTGAAIVVVGVVSAGIGFAIGAPDAVPPVRPLGGQPMVSQIACKGCGRVYAEGAHAFCPACGQKLGAVGQVPPSSGPP